MHEKLHQLVERLWKDVESLPWQEKAWVNNSVAREESRRHFIHYTTKDIEAIIALPEISTDSAVQIVVDMLDQEMQENPTPELANTSNYLQKILDNNKADK